MKVDKGIFLRIARQPGRLAWRHLLNGLHKVAPVTATKLLYFRKTGKVLDVKHPRDFNEKLQWLKLYWNDPLVSVCADKYELYHYVAGQGCGHILNKLLAVYESADDIVWADLPEKFALKCTHGSGYNIVTRNKRELDPDEVRKTLDKWMGEKFGRRNLEPHYDRIPPRIILEEYIENRDGGLPFDYKIYCFNGEAKLVEVCSERTQGLRLDFFDLAWRRLAISFEERQNPTPPEKPACFDEMVAYAAKLSRPFPFVRIDFYDKDGVPILGEMTFTPGSSMSTCYNDDGLRILGDLLELPNESARFDPEGTPHIT